MAQQKIISGNAYKLYIGKIMAAGAVSDTTKWADLSLRNTAKNNASQDTTVAQTTTAGVRKPYSAGTFLYQVKNKYVIRSVSDTISGVTTNIVRLVGSDYNRVAHSPSRGNRRYNITSWNYVTGAATKGVNAGDQVNFHDIAANNDNLSVEVMAPNVIPGEFTYRNGSANPVNADYINSDGY